MTKKEAKAKLVALVDEFLQDQEFDYEEFADWKAEFQDWLDNKEVE